MSYRAPEKKNKPGRKQAHQNVHKFIHNPNSKLTKHIYAIEHEGLCTRCEQIIEWRKDYRKYKPLKEPRRCIGCLDKTVTRAYHQLCAKCSKEKVVCAKCCEPCDASTKEKPVTAEQVELALATADVKERTKRSIARNWERGQLKPEDVIKLITAASHGENVDWREYKVDADAEGGGADGEDSDAEDRAVAARILKDLEDRPTARGKSSTSTTTVTQTSTLTSNASASATSTTKTLSSMPSSTSSSTGGASKPVVKSLVHSVAPPRRTTLDDDDDDDEDEEGDDEEDVDDEEDDEGDDVSASKAKSTATPSKTPAQPSAASAASQSPSRPSSASSSSSSPSPSSAYPSPGAATVSPSGAPRQRMKLVIPNRAALSLNGSSSTPTKDANDLADKVNNLKV